MTLDIGGHLLTAIVVVTVAVLLREYWRFRTELVRSRVGR